MFPPKIFFCSKRKTDDNQDEHNQACQQADGAFVCVYFPSGGRERLDLKALGTGPYAGWWFNPRDGKCYANAQTHTQKPMRMDGSKGILDVRSPTAGPHLDWVLVVERQRPDPVVPGRAQNYGEHTANAEVKKSLTGERALHRGRHQRESNGYGIQTRPTALTKMLVLVGRMIKGSICRADGSVCESNLSISARNSSSSS